MMKLKALTAGMLAALLLFGTACSSSAGDLSSTADDRKIVMTVGGEKVEYQEFRYYYLNNKRDLFGADAKLDADQVSELKALSEANAKQRHGLVLFAEKYKAKLTEEAVDYAEKTVEDFRASMGDDETYLIALEEHHLTHELFSDITLENQLPYAILEKMIEKGDIPSGDAAIDAVLASDDIICIKEIFISNNTPETKEIVRERAEEAHAKLMEGGEFEQLMKEYSDYSEENLPTEHGYYTMKYDALDEIWDVAVTLAPGEHSIVVESAYGFHIIKRCEKDPAYMNEKREEIFESYTYARFSEMFEAFSKDLEVKYTSYGEGLDFVNLS